MTTDSSTTPRKAPAKRRTTRRTGAKSGPAPREPVAWDAGYRSTQRVWPD